MNRNINRYAPHSITEKPTSYIPFVKCAIFLITLGGGIIFLCLSCHRTFQPFCLGNRQLSSFFPNTHTSYSKNCSKCIEEDYSCKQVCNQKCYSSCVNNCITWQKYICYDGYYTAYDLVHNISCTLARYNDYVRPINITMYIIYNGYIDIHTRYCYLDSSSVDPLIGHVLIQLSVLQICIYLYKYCINQCTNKILPSDV